MAPVWPVGIPQGFQQDGFTYRKGDPRRELTTGAGARRLDREASGTSGEMAGMFYLTPSEFGTLELFFDSTLASGILDFDMPNQLEIGGDPVRCRFIGRPGVDRYLGPELWQVGVRLEILP